MAPLSGAAFRYGREAKSEFQETIPPDTADAKTMGMSCIMVIRETAEKKEFTPPSWAYVFETDADLPYKDHNTNTNFWWIELGGEWDCIHDTDRCREECLKIVYGVWDHMKNRGNHGVDNWELEWVGNEGDSICYSFKEPVQISRVRLVFDSDLNRKYKNMPYVLRLNEDQFKTPKTLIRDYVIELVTEDGREIRIEQKDNYQRFVVLDLTSPEFVEQIGGCSPCIVSARLIPKSTHGCETFRVFNFELA